MKSLYGPCKKNICMMVLFSLLLCSFWGLQYDFHLVSSEHEPLQQGSYVSEVTGIFEIISSEEISVSTSQAVILRKLLSKKGSEVVFHNDILPTAEIPFIFFALLSFFNLCTDAIRRSHRFIMEFIHKKDGQKATFFLS